MAPSLLTQLRVAGPAQPAKPCLLLQRGPGKTNGAVARVSSKSSRCRRARSRARSAAPVRTATRWIATIRQAEVTPGADTATRNDCHDQAGRDYAEELAVGSGEAAAFSATLRQDKAGSGASAQQQLASNKRSRSVQPLNENLIGASTLTADHNIATPSSGPPTLTIERQRSGWVPRATEQWDGDGVPLADSNCAEIGSSADKTARKAAASTEFAWHGAGGKPGLRIWRIEAFQVIPVDKQTYGTFYTGDSYIILETAKKGDKLEHHIFFWLGAETSIDEKGTAAYKTVELDDLFDGKASQNREVMGRESEQFKALMKRECQGIRYLDGGVESGFHRVGPEAYQAKLIHIRKTKKHGIIQKEVTRVRESLNEGDCFVLDAGKHIYVWSGTEASGHEKFQASIVAQEIEKSRHGHARRKHEHDETFWELLGGEGPIRSAAEGTDQIASCEPGEGVLYRLSESSSQLTWTEVGRGNLEKAMLKSEDVFVLDHDTEVCIWIGKEASKAESRSALRVAIDFLKTNSRDMTTPIHLYKEGRAINNPVWNAVFGN